MPSLALGGILVTDQPAYQTGDTVVITGMGYYANEQVTVQVQPLDGSPGPGQSPWTTIASPAGNFTTTWVVPSEYYNDTMQATATGNQSGPPGARTLFVAAPPQADLDQARNGTPSSPTSPVNFVNGNAGSSNSHYREGHSIPYRMVFTNLVNGAHNVKIEWDIRNNGKNAIDYITQFDRILPHTFSPAHTPETIDPLDGLSGTFGSPSTFAIPAPSSAGSPVAGQPTTSFNGLPAGERVLTIYNGTITGVSYVSQGNLTASNSSTQLSIDFTSSSATVVLAWGGHIASALDWGAGNSAGGINGSPYHSRLIEFDGGGGNQDRSLSALAVVAPPTCTLTGLTSVCSGTTNAYSVTTNACSPIYSWSFTSNTSGAAFIGSTTGSSVTVSAGSGGQYIIRVTINSCDGFGIFCEDTVAVNALPACSINGPNLVCPGSSNVHCAPAGLPSYSWSISGSGTIAGSSTSQCVTVQAGSGCNTSYTLNLDVSGACNSSCSKTVQVRDITKPAISCPANIVQGNDPGQCGASVSFSSPAADNCPGAVSVVCTPSSGSFFAIGTTNVKCVATDACNNKDSCAFSVTVNDTEGPMINCPPNIVKGNDPNNCDTVVTFTAFATDNCPGVSYVCSPPSGSSFPVGTTVVTCTATDAVGHQASCQFTVTVNDVTGPTIVCSPNIVTGTDPGRCDAAVTYTVTASNGCPGVTLVCNPPSGSIFPKGTTTVNCTATDVAGNQASCSFTVTVNDNEKPTVFCPANIVTSTVPGRCDATVSYTASATDNCPGVTFACTPPSGSVFSKGVTPVTCTATDAAGNTASCSFTVTVNDGEKPTVFCPANIVTSTVPGRCDATVSYTASATDNCPGVTFACTPPSGSVFPKGVTPVTCTATDASGNTASCSFTVTVNDNEKPTVSCPANISTNTAPGRCDANVIYTATPSDNCPGVNLVCTPPSGSVFSKGTNPVKCVVTDASGNKDSCSFTVTVNDNEKPTVSCPDNITTNTTARRCDANVTYTATPGDNCPGVTLVCTPPSGSIFPKGVTPVTCTAIDAAGNQASCSFTVTVNDNEKPTVVCPANITVSHSSENCSNTVNYTPPSGSDNCPGPVNVVCTPPSGFVFPFGTTTVTCVATDGAGNKDSCAFTITVTNQPPTVSVRDTSIFTCPGNQVCLSISAFDPDPGDIITVEKVSGPGSFSPVTGPTPVNALFCFIPDANGFYQFVFQVTNSCGAIDVDTVNVDVRCLIPPPGPCLALEIDTVRAFLGSDVEVSITNPEQFTDPGVSPNPSGIGGFSFLFSYDCSCLQFLSARKGALLVEQGWEFFTFRYGAIGNGNCGSGCPSCLIRIVAIADINNGAAHPNLSRDNAGEWAVLKFRVSGDRTLNGMCCPINWYWFDCADNTVSDSTGNTLWVARGLSSADGDPIDLAAAFPVDVSNCDQFSGGPGKPSPRKSICFRNGRICIPFDKDIDARCDLNLNELPYDAGDVVLYENYFIYGSGVFDPDPTRRQAQIAASDCNGDGLPLTVADLVTLIRVLTRDAFPLPKLHPTAPITLGWSANASELTLVTESGSEMGALFVRFQYSGTAEAAKTLAAPEGMKLWVSAEAGELRILLAPDKPGARLPAGQSVFRLPVAGELAFVEAQAANFLGFPLPVAAKTAALPTAFALSQNYPNPFNPKTDFTLSMPISGHYKISIYNLLGEAVRTFEGEAPAGRQVFTWDGRDIRGRAVSSGLYFYKAEVGKEVIIKKMMLLR